MLTTPIPSNAKIAVLKNKGIEFPIAGLDEIGGKSMLKLKPMIISPINCKIFAKAETTDNALIERTKFKTTKIGQIISR